MLKKISFFLLILLIFTNSLTFEEKLNDDVFNYILLPTFSTYKKVITDKEVDNFLININISSKNNKIYDYKSLKEIIKIFQSNFFSKYNKKIRDRINQVIGNDFILRRAYPGISARESGGGRLMNANVSYDGGYGAFQLTYKGGFCKIIASNNIILNTGKRVYTTPVSICEGIYTLCNKRGNQNGCYCSNKEFRFNEARKINGKNGFNANEWTSLYNSYCDGKEGTANFFSDIGYNYQLFDFFGFIYNKIGGGYSLKKELLDGKKRYNRHIMNIGELLNLYKPGIKENIDIIVKSYIKNVNGIADLSDENLNFNIEGKKTNYQQYVNTVSNKMGITPDKLKLLLNSYQLSILLTKYNGMGNVGKNFFDNSYVSNLTEYGAKQLGIDSIVKKYIFKKMNGRGSYVNDKQSYGGLIYSLIFNGKKKFLSFLLVKMFPKLIQSQGFYKLVDW